MSAVVNMALAKPSHVLVMRATSVPPTSRMEKFHACQFSALMDPTDWPIWRTAPIWRPCWSYTAYSLVTSKTLAFWFTTRTGSVKMVPPPADASALAGAPVGALAGLAPGAAEREPGAPASRSWAARVTCWCTWSGLDTPVAYAQSSEDSVVVTPRVATCGVHWVPSNQRCSYRA